MTALIAPVTPSPIVYPDTDGLPMAENTFQFEWIVTIKGGVDHLFADAQDVFVAGDLFWYPVAGHPEICAAPDVMVVFGRPKGHRLSYLQWEEGGIAPQVVFEVLSPGNRFGDMLRKFEFYQQYGVEEYYLYRPDPQHLDLSGYLRNGSRLVEISSMNGHVSPRLRVKFEMDGDGLHIIRPDGRPFESYGEVARREEQAQRKADEERARADQADRRAEQAEQRAERERERAEQLQAEVERLRREARG